MHDIKSLRADPAAFDAGLARRGVAAASGRVLAIDTALRQVQTEVQAMLARRNDLSRDIGAAKARKDDAGAAALMAEVARLKDAIPALEASERALSAEIDAALAELPNLPAADVPDGLDETGNIVVKSHGTIPEFAFKPVEHDIIAARLGYDPDAAARIAGARFAVLKGPLARLHRALGQYMLDVQTGAHGYAETAVPLLVNERAVFGAGQLPKFEEDLFKTSDGRYLISTAEVPLTNLVRESILDEDSLPLRLTALTPCFRSEAGSAGRDTRGLIRQHQFEKVELVAICTPDQAAAEHDHMLGAAEAILEQLGLPYRRMLLCSGDMGFAAKKTFDLEVWLPGQGAYREISSISDCGDFQGRRMAARYRTRGEKGSKGFVNTLNGSGLAVGRTLVAVIENHQQADGSVRVPQVLHAYMGGITELTPA
ncbi:serine--tRNA ligase [Polymorphobacter fuscus]|uniref:Serine--tRNA ligase n=1 Tax=Sandarakinorhabdus fusca TaxID=1439888 RepID=A0A7C9GPP8_9SPHN|nr:serine--tRNA ligase [Polymorphobacter fuscus]KAB7646472.1 serine--tRNA ligase [Polymorphobacter fuscus]MQT17715.1 serine--tRNA ligase [Polymorphobacter fuscus]NJC09737.1 seryl-tRNA synthetase [Polymorphobacter fuscus]